MESLDYLMDESLVKTGDKRLWHGGIRGLKAGDRILPPSQTKTPYTLLDYSQEVAPGIQDKDKVYVSPNRSIARAYAMMYPGGGALYLVRVTGELRDDPDVNDPGISFETDEAEVVSVYDPAVQPNPRKALRVLQRGGL